MEFHRFRKGPPIQADRIGKILIGPFRNIAGKIQHGKQQPSRRFDMKALDIRMIREQSNKSRLEFAYMIGISMATLRNWEQGRRRPEGPAPALLKIVSKNPEYVEQLLTGDYV
ncbi:MAG: helix-turn-helix domain-containing protein [Spirochaetota bacterium]